MTRAVKPEVCAVRRVVLPPQPPHPRLQWRAGHAGLLVCLSRPRPLVQRCLARAHAERCARGVLLCLRSPQAARASGPRVRLLDLTGAPSSAGLLEVRTGEAAADSFGTVCGLNLAAADVVCRQLGFDYGSVSTSPCGSYGGANMCGPAGAPVAVKNLRCVGGELDFTECVWSPPDVSCGGHASDSIVYCGYGVGPARPAEGSVRLLSADGAPSMDAEGRLEVYKAGTWGPVCREGFSSGSALVACRALGFAGAKAAAPPAKCAGFHGENACGTTPPRISKLACSGHEGSLLACPFDEGEDVFCAAEASRPCHA